MRAFRSGMSPVRAGLIALVIILIGSWFAFSKDIPFTQTYRIEAVSCNAASCPAPSGADVARPDYVERRRVATVCLTATGDGC